LVEVNAILVVKGATAIGVQDAYTFSGGNVHADWDNHKGRASVDLSGVLVSKANTAVYVVDTLAVRYSTRGGIEIRAETWRAREIDGERQAGLDVQEMAYSGSYLVQWESEELEGV
jgi:hypothetical protein